MENKKKLEISESDSFLETKSASTESSRDQWGSSRTFMLVLLGYAVGLGNVWRFPYLCYKYGGGAFLIPYFFFVIIAGIPMFFLEISLGQFTKLSAIQVWKIAPVMKGVGYGCACVNAFCGIYYIIILAWSFLYLYHSCVPGDLPWTTCDNWWNTPNCTDNIMKVGASAATTAVGLVSNSTNSSTKVIFDAKEVMSAAEFWKYYILRQSSGLHEMGAIDNWPMFVAFLVSWICIYLCIFKGVTSSGKVVYFSATAPYLMLFVLFVRGISLDGAFDGVAYLFKPDFAKLAMSETWVSAGSQIFYTFGICFTVLFAFGSYNPKSNNCYKQSITLVACGCATSIFASLVIFSILGHLAHSQQVPIDQVASQGPGLAFFVYPVGLSLLPAPKVWSFLFFATLVLVGIDTQFSGIEALVSTIIDTFPNLTRKRRYGRELLSGVVCFVVMVFGLPLLSQGGIYLFELYNTYAASGVTLLWMAMCESIAIGWVYGVDRFYDDMRSMLGFAPHNYFRLCYQYLIPIFTFAIFIFHCINSHQLTVNGYTYPWWATMIGWLMSSVSMLCVPIGIAYHIFVHGTDGLISVSSFDTVEQDIESEKKGSSSEVNIEENEQIIV